MEQKDFFFWKWESGKKTDGLYYGTKRQKLEDCQIKRNTCIALDKYSVFNDFGDSRIQIFVLIPIL